MTDQHIGKWIFTYSGTKFWPLDPRPEDMDLTTIAYALSKQCRYAGHTHRFFSVAEHSIWLVVAYLLRSAKWTDMTQAGQMSTVVDVVRFLGRYLRTHRLTSEEAIIALWLILHDATETWFQDMLRPIKDELPDYRFMEDRATDIVAKRFDLPLPIPDEVHQLDKQMVLDEVIALGPNRDDVSLDGVDTIPGAATWIDQIDWVADKTPVGIPGHMMGKATMDDVAEAFLGLFRALSEQRRAAKRLCDEREGAAS